MTEFDFEELDKAVSDLMKDNGTPKSDASAMATNQTATPSTMEQPASISPTEPLAVKRRGKFMDVMAPARNSTNRPLANHGPVKIDTPNVSQPVDMNQDDDSETNTPVSEPNISNEQPEINTKGDYATDPAPVNEWPDPIDFNSESGVGEGKSAPETQEVEVNEPSSIGISENDHSNASENEQENPPVIDDKPEDVKPEPESEPEVNNLDTVMEPDLPSEQKNQYDTAETSFAVNSSSNEADSNMESPFLPDPKVEKRPLGVFAADTEADKEIQNEQQPVENDKLEVEQPSVVSPDLPRELSSELMGLESDSDPVVTEDEQVKADENVAVPAVEPQTGLDDQPEIKQQYTEKPATETKPSGAIYDTDSYHQPIVVANAGKKRKWPLYIIGVLVMLIIGACAGALYFYLSIR